MPALEDNNTVKWEAYKLKIGNHLDLAQGGLYDACGT